jgi:hypothetical protein
MAGGDSIVSGALACLHVRSEWSVGLCASAAHWVPGGMAFEQVIEKKFSNSGGLFGPLLTFSFSRFLFCGVRQSSIDVVEAKRGVAR